MAQHLAKLVIHMRASLASVQAWQGPQAAPGQPHLEGDG